MQSFTALSDPIRRRIVELLAHSELPASAIAAQFSCTGPAISHHLKVLHEAGLVQRRKEAQRRIYALDPAGLQQINAWVTEQLDFWDKRLDRLEAQILSDVARSTHGRGRSLNGRGDASENKTKPKTRRSP